MRGSVWVQRIFVRPIIRLSPFPPFFPGGDGETALLVSLEAVALLSSASTQRWSARYQAEAHLNVFQLATALEKTRLARDHLEHAHRMNLLLQGPRSADSRSTAQKLEALEKEKKKNRAKRSSCSSNAASNRLRRETVDVHKSVGKPKKK